MSKYFIEYPNHKLFICCDNLCAYINLIITCNVTYLYVQFVYPRTKMFYGIKQVMELKNESSSLYEVINMVVDKYLGIITEKNNFQYMLLPKIFRNKDSSNIYTYICSSNSYYDTFADDISSDSVRNKSPLLYYICLYTFSLGVLIK